MKMEHFGGDRERQNHDHPEPQPELQIIPAVPEKDIVPDAEKIPPAVRQEIIDDINKQEEEEREREKRIDEITRKRKSTEN